MWKYVLLCLFTFQSALLSGGDVIIVIGGDNKYKGEDEEERQVISGKFSHSSAKSILMVERAS